MKSRRQYHPFSREAFERTLEDFKLREVPPVFYEYEWVEKGDKWIYARRKAIVQEICYVINIKRDRNRWLLIYSSIDRTTGNSRAIGTDAIRTILVKDNQQPRESRRRRINRTGNWRGKILERVWEYINERD